jgi:DNA-binding MarR family transcriptional regulator
MSEPPIPDRMTGPDVTGPDVTEDEIAAFQTATRDLIGIALRSLDAMSGQVSLPQMRMLLALNDLGRCPSSRVAQALGLGASSITRLADRLVASGHIVRGSAPHHRSVVTLELSPRGREVVAAVLRWRHDELARVLALLPAGQRAATAEGMRAFHRVLGEAYAAEMRGPVPL